MVKNLSRMQNRKKLRKPAKTYLKSQCVQRISEKKWKGKFILIIQEDEKAIEKVK